MLAELEARGALLIEWIESKLFHVDCNLPRDPGRVTIRRLNRTEYNNTIRDLVGVDFKPAKDFPSDDVGEGFDNIGDVLSLSPLSRHWLSPSTCMPMKSSRTAFFHSSLSTRRTLTASMTKPSPRRFEECADLRPTRFR